MNTSKSIFWLLLALHLLPAAAARSRAQPQAPPAQGQPSAAATPADRPASEQQYVEEAERLYRDGDLAGAQAKLTECIKHYPGSLPCLVTRGENWKDAPSAIADFTAAIQIEPKNAELYRRRIGAYHLLRGGVPVDDDGDEGTKAARQIYDKMIADYSHVVALAPGDPDAYTDRAQAYIEKWFDVGVTALPPDLLPAYVEEHTKAINDYTRAISLAPQKPNLYGGRGQAYARRAEARAEMRKGAGGPEGGIADDHANALNDYAQAIKLDPQNPRYYLWRADVYDRLGQRVGAEADRRKADELHKKN